MTWTAEHDERRALWFALTSTVVLFFLTASVAGIYWHRGDWLASTLVGWYVGKLGRTLFSGVVHDLRR